MVAGMSFSNKIKAVAQRVPQEPSSLETEEATKNALVMPFILALGYDVFDPREVVPEFTADVGTKKGEKVDYAIRHGDAIIMLVEAKKAGVDLSNVHASQLYRYFSVTSARIGVLTNGIVYQFYSDLDEPNKMDAKPFLEIDLRTLRDDAILQLQKLTKEQFDLEAMLSSATDLKYMRGIRQAIERQLEQPGDDFVKFFFAQVNPSGRFVQSVKEQFGALVRQTFQQLISDRVSERLHAALAQEAAGATLVPGQAVGAQQNEASPGEADVEEKDGNHTTEEELEGFRVVKAIVCSVVSPERINYRDGKTYFSVLVDNSNRKPICRLWFNGKQKYLGIMDEARNETRHPISSSEEIYNYLDHLHAVARRYVKPEAGTSGATEVAESA